MAIVKDIGEFLNDGNSYLRFVTQLRDHFTAGASYNRIRVTKPDGFTKVTLQYGSLVSISFIYRNSDLYIIGICDQPTRTLYLARDAYDHYINHPQLGGLSVACVPTRNLVRFERLAIPFDYNNILVGTEPVTRFILGAKLMSLNRFRTGNNRVPALRNLGPIVVAFSEAIRFELVAQMISRNGINPMNSSIFRSFSYMWLLTSWGKLSKIVKEMYIDGRRDWPVLQYRGDNLQLNIRRFHELLAVAAYSQVHSRYRRDTSQLINQQLPPNKMQPTNLEQHGIAGSNATLTGPTPTSNPISSPKFNLDVLGALQLLTLGILYLSGRKWTPKVGPSGVDPREAQAIAVDLAAKIDCLAGSKDFDETMRTQRTLAKALINGDDVVRVMVGIVGTRFREQGRPVKDAKRVISNELAKRGGLDFLENSGADLMSCFGTG